MKISIYQRIIRLVVTYGAEAWTMRKEEEEMLRRWERKILRGIYGAVREGEEWRIRTNGEIQQLYQKPDIVVEIKRARMRWAGHV
jgi:hypothetical protein